MCYLKDLSHVCFSTSGEFEDETAPRLSRADVDQLLSDPTRLVNAQQKLNSYLIRNKNFSPFSSLRNGLVVVGGLVSDLEETCRLEQRGQWEEATVSSS